MSLSLDGLPFALDAAGPDGRWTHADGTVTGRAGPGQDLFVPRPATVPTRPPTPRACSERWGRATSG